MGHTRRSHGGRLPLYPHSLSWVGLNCQMERICWAEEGRQWQTELRHPMESNRSAWQDQPEDVRPSPSAQHLRRCPPNSAIKSINS